MLYSITHVTIQSFFTHLLIKIIISRDADMRCWLCEYSMDPLAQQISKYMIENAGAMGPTQMAICIHEKLVQTDPDAEGIGLDDILEHINSHTLNPSVRISTMMRNLLDLSDKLSTMLIVREGSQIMVEKQNVSIYLKVVNEIMQMYKTSEPNKLLFADVDYSHMDIK